MANTKREDNICAWNPEALRSLIDSTVGSVYKVSEATGIKTQSLFKYCQGSNVPGISTLIKLADYFCVPLDYLTGRCDEETAKELLNDYSACFMKIRRGPWEEYLLGRNRLRKAVLKTSSESPWPYNLLDDIVCDSSDKRRYCGGVITEDGERWGSTLSEDQENGLRKALLTLTKQEQECVMMYYEQGNTLESIGERYGVTRERIRQIISKALHKLRHPSRLRLIELGPELIADTDEYEKRREELDRKLAVLDEDEKVLSERLKRLSEARLLLQANGMWYQGISVKEDSGDAKPSAIDYQPITTTPIEAMDLSVRSYNCLKRRDLTTLGLVMDAARSGELSKVRNLGRKSLEEVLNKIKAITGEDYSALYGR